MSQSFLPSIVFSIVAFLSILLPLLSMSPTSNNNNNSKTRNSTINATSAAAAAIQDSVAHANPMKVSGRSRHLRCHFSVFKSFLYNVGQLLHHIYSLNFNLSVAFFQIILVIDAANLKSYHLDLKLPHCISEIVFSLHFPPKKKVMVSISMY